VLINYALAKPYEDIVHALAIIESGENPSISGDGGQAWGLLQMHPSRFKECYGCAAEYLPAVDDTWIDAQIKACAAFLDLWSNTPLDLRIVAWRLGVHAVMDEGKRDPQYLQRFNDALNKVKGIKTIHATQNETP
jgi:hypothetical protein